MFERALYYPTIDIHNDAWLKSAALFWDRIETIVPESEERPYRRRSTRLLQDEGILFAHRVNPYSEEVSGLEEDVIKSYYILAFFYPYYLDVLNYFAIFAHGKGCRHL